MIGEEALGLLQSHIAREKQPSIVIWNTVYFRGNTEAAIRDQGYTFEIRLFNTTKRIDLAYFILKNRSPIPKASTLRFLLN